MNDFTPISLNLRNLASEIKSSGRGRRMTVRNLLGLIGQSRRGKLVSKRLRHDLRHCGLQTEPDFEQLHIDALVTVIAQAPQTPPSQPKGISTSDLPPKIPPPQGAEAELDREVVLSIGQMLPKDRKPIFITRDDPVERAVTLLLQENISHLVVSQNERTADGIVSWQSIGRARASQRPDKTVADCMDADPHTVSYTAALFDTVRHIVQSGAVLVKGPDKRIDGIVTAADIAQQFIVLSEPFLFLEQCENQLRSLLRRAKAGGDLLRTFVDPRDEARAKRLKDADDLTFGETIRAIGSGEIWDKLKLGLDRKTFVARLEELRNIRNMVMHFHPDGISEEDRALLNRTRQMLQQL